MKKNVFTFVLLIIITTGLFIACSKSSSDTTLLGNWVKLSDFEGVPRSNAVAFNIANKGYVGTGYDGSERLKDFWEYDPVKNSWKQIADLPDSARNGAVGFAIDTKGYVGTGYNGTDKLNDFWEYNPTTNKWTRKADFAGTARYDAVGFSIGSLGYIGTGFDGNYLKDFWAYNPQSDTWTQKTSVGGSKRTGAVGFVIDGKGYICTGVDNGIYENDFWEYDPDADIWTKKRSISDATSEDFDNDYTSIVGTGKVAFSANGKGYVATGGQGTVGNNVWEYDPLTDLWQEKTNFEGASRLDAVAFTINNVSYVTTGRSSSYFFDDIWSFEPDKDYNEYD